MKQIGKERLLISTKGLRLRHIGLPVIPLVRYPIDNRRSTDDGVGSFGELLFGPVLFLYVSYYWLLI